MSTFPSRAMRQLTDVEEVRRAINTRRVMHDRDRDTEAAASLVYENLRMLDMAGLLRLHPDPEAVSGFSRAAVIADLIALELER